MNTFLVHFQVGLKKNENNDDEWDGDEDGEEEDEEISDLIVTSDEQSCAITQSDESKTALEKGYVIVLKYCPNPCGNPGESDGNLKNFAGSPMCLRTCSCPKNYVMGKDGKCKEMKQEFKDIINKNYEEKIKEEKYSRRDKREYIILYYCTLSRI